MTSVAAAISNGLQRIFQPFLVLSERRPGLWFCVFCVFIVSLAFAWIEASRLWAPVPRFQDLTCTTGRIDRVVDRRRLNYVEISTAEGSQRYAPRIGMKDEEGSSLYFCYADDHFFPGFARNAKYRIYYSVLEGQPSYNFEEARAELVRMQEKGNFRIKIWLAFLLLSGATLFWPWRKPDESTAPLAEKDSSPS